MKIINQLTKIVMLIIFILINYQYLDCMQSSDKLDANDKLIRMNNQSGQSILTLYNNGMPRIIANVIFSGWPIETHLGITISTKQGVYQLNTFENADTILENVDNSSLRKTLPKDAKDIEIFVDNTGKIILQRHDVPVNDSRPKVSIKVYKAIADYLTIGSDPRALLGLPTWGPIPSQDEIRKAYKQLILKWSPDRNTSPLAKDAFQLIDWAYRSLTK